MVHSVPIVLQKSANDLIWLPEVVIACWLLKAVDLSWGRQRRLANQLCEAP
jgi:hypothetical protein